MANNVSARAWQVIAMEKWKEAGFRGCFSVATGGGKTWFAIAAIIELSKINKELRSLIVVPTTVLLDQWFDAIAESVGSDEEIKALTGQDLNPNAKFNLVVINTARRFKNKLEDKSNLLLIVDEVHRAAGDENYKALIDDVPFTLGLSATPEREYDNFFQERVVPRLGPILHEYSLDEAIRDGVLSGLKITNLRVPMLPQEQEKYDRLSKRVAQAYARNESQDRINDLLRKRSKVSNEAAYRIPATASMLDRQRGKRTIVFLESISAAESLKKILSSRGHSVSIYHSGLSIHLRRSNLRLFRKGIFDVLITCRALDEGFNVPEAELAIIAAGTASKRQRIQRIGRVLRSRPGKEVGEVLTIFASDSEERRLREESEAWGQSVNTNWLELKK